MARRCKAILDPDLRKGANEEHGKALVSYSGQVPHRGTLPLVKDYDSDFPEPGISPEHSGEGARRSATRRKRR